MDLPKLEHSSKNPVIKTAALFKREERRRKRGSRSTLSKMMRNPRMSIMEVIMVTQNMEEVVVVGV